MALWLATFMALGLALVGADAIIRGRIDVVTLSDGLSISVCALIGAAWLYYSQEALRGTVWVGTVVLLAITLPLSWKAMQRYPYQNLEQAFVRAIQTGNSQEGTLSLGRYRVGIGSEQQMASYVVHHVGEHKHLVLTDNAQTFGTILLSGRPQVMFDRVDEGDGAWLNVRNDPFGKVRYMLIAYRSPADLIEPALPARGQRRRAGSDAGVPHRPLPAGEGRRPRSGRPLGGHVGRHRGARRMSGR